MFVAGIRDQLPTMQTLTFEYSHKFSSVTTVLKQCACSLTEHNLHTIFMNQCDAEMKFCIIGWFLCRWTEKSEREYLPRFSGVHRCGGQRVIREKRDDDQGGRCDWNFVAWDHRTSWLFKVKVKSVIRSPEKYYLKPLPLTRVVLKSFYRKYLSSCITIIDLVVSGQTKSYFWQKWKTFLRNFPSTFFNSWLHLSSKYNI